MKVVKTNERRATRQDGVLVREEFECGRYSIVKNTINYVDREDAYTSITVRNNSEDRYLPTVYYNDWSCFDEGSVKFTIQTTSYGDLDPEEIVKVINGYNEAIEAVEALTEYFID